MHQFSFNDCLFLWSVLSKYEVDVFFLNFFNPEFYLIFRFYFYDVYLIVKWSFSENRIESLDCYRVNLFLLTLESVWWLLVFFVLIASWGELLLIPWRNLLKSPRLREFLFLGLFFDNDFLWSLISVSLSIEVLEDKDDRLRD